MPPFKNIADFDHPFKKGKPYADLAQKLGEIRAEKDGGMHDVSGPSGGGTFGTNTLAVSTLGGIRILHWNVQDLGGGPSRGPERPGWVLDRIASIIYECDPDVVVILEVKRLGPRPKRPKRRARFLRVLRNRKIVTIVNRQIKDYKKRLERYKLAIKRYDEASKAGIFFGFRQLDEILERLNANGSKRCAYVDYPVNRFTNGESYGILVRDGLFSSTTFEIVPGEWPNADCRAPGYAKLTFQVGLVQRDLHVVAFHAPAPSHGEVTFDAVEKIAGLNLEEFVFASDTNLSTDAAKREHADRAMGSYHKALAVGGLTHENTDVQLRFAATFSGAFVKEGTRYELDACQVECSGTFVREDWTNYGETQKTATYQGSFTGILSSTDSKGRKFDWPVTAVIFVGRFTFKPLNKASQNFFRALSDARGSFHHEPSLGSGEYTGATSLRRKVSAAPRPVKVKYANTEVFNANAYDKLEYVCRDHCNFWELAKYVYPLFERCLPPVLLKKHFTAPWIDRDDVLLQIETEAQNAPATLQKALDATNQVSDHVPLILDLAILTPGVSAGDLERARAARVGQAIQEKPSGTVLMEDDYNSDDDPDYHPGEETEEDDAVWRRRTKRARIG